MRYQAVFMRYEMKYLITAAQKEKIIDVMAPYMALDSYGRTTIRNLYYDTAQFRLARRSIEKPVYKEKLRVRSYSKTQPDGLVFVELKKKYGSTVYKRRLAMTEREAMEWLSGETPCLREEQIAYEIDYFRDYYQTLRPAAFLSYEREAYYSRDGSSFRVTFDENILCRQEALSLEADAWGSALLEKETVLMEIKCCGGLPLWMTGALSQGHIYKSSFSKYGAAYQTVIYPKSQGEYCYA